MKTITVLNAKGKRREIEVASIEIPLSEGRYLRLAFPPGDMGDLAVEAHSEAGLPVMLVQPGAANLATLHVLSVAEPEGESEPAEHDLELTVQKELGKDEKKGLPSKAAVREWIGAALGTDAEINVRFVGEAESQALNKEYRGKDSSTNVLSFPYTEEPLVVGDLVVCWPVVQREAREQGKALEAHAAHMIVHGTLHLQGWDHENEDDAEEMESVEREILSALGYPDPYAA
ncbi:rRNA maturation RNase YbeY [Niveibacterium umoris]|uniref:Endoribonuclease YbeY n=1 Tax=Niveibacterium umoris TaxID=1193620 RepID=A0A840BP17_9RHOO|nr:rRNA maturation RNase YbeY [Niveibacterium umoris]MBB4012197.1 putative rRNA maturation factor [Niveibacterium umoris]